MAPRYGRRIIGLPSSNLGRPSAYQGGGARTEVLTVADLEVNVLEFRRRSFQFERLLERAGESYAVFSRTETESERQLRPKLVHLTLVVPLAWLVQDAEDDALRVARDGVARPRDPAPAVEVAAEAPEFEEDGERWKRVPSANGYAYAPLELAPQLLSREGLAELGVG
jgi:hypothetical protein